MNPETRRSATKLERGLYAVRYVSSDSQDELPARVQPSSGYERSVRIISGPGREAGVLKGPGACLVVVVDDESKVEIIIDAKSRNKNVDAKFNFELLDRGDTAAVESTVSESTKIYRKVEPQRVAVDVSIKAHLSYRGDVECRGGEWVGGPVAPAPIEGFACKCFGADIGIEASYVNSLSKGEWSDWTSVDGFIGTWGKASPLTGLKLRLRGSDLSKYVLAAEGMFLGSPSIFREGIEVELRTAALTDSLVGLRLKILSSSNESAAVPQQAPRARVFRPSRSS